MYLLYIYICVCIGVCAACAVISESMLHACLDCDVSLFDADSVSSSGLLAGAVTRRQVNELFKYHENIDVMVIEGISYKPNHNPNNPRYGFDPEHGYVSK